MLTNKQKNIIQKKRGRFSADYFAEKFNLNIEEIEVYLSSNPHKNTPLWFYLILIILPFILLLVLEISLRIFNFGENYDEWIDLTDKYEILNPDIAKKYFSEVKSVPFSTESFLLKNKPFDSFRIIVLGASSGAGYPYQNSGSFSKYLRKSFQYALPTKRVEVSNISMAAINSYTILDLLPGIIEKAPDLIIIYLGHNEYYGALGVGSNMSIGNSRFITNLVLGLKKFKVYQLTEKIIGNVRAITTGEENLSDGTLMSKIVGEKLIEFNSELYNNGVDQFEGNLSDILNLCRDNNIPVIISTLVSNLKDLKPFNSIEIKGAQSAQMIYNDAFEKFHNDKFKEADSLFRLAKDLDGLRFRAPEEFNRIIKKLAIKFGAAIVDADSALNSKSVGGIIGNELIVDHLHPNLNGYMLIGKLFFDKIREGNLIALKSNSIINDVKLDSIVKANYNFTKYDSTISDFRIKILKNDWPFIDPKNKIDQTRLLKVNSIESKISNDVLDGNISRLQARLNLGDYYKNENNEELFAKEMLAFIDEFPTEKEILNNSIDQLIKAKKYHYTEKMLEASYYLEPDAFNTKWLGILNMSNAKFDKALFYLNQSNKFYNGDAQVLINLAGIYYNKKDFKTSYEYTIECLTKSPNYKNAEILKSRLERILKK